MGINQMRALSIRQPWAELILLGHKTIEARSRRTNNRERVHICAARGRIEKPEEARISEQFGLDIDGLPRGVVVGTVEIVGCRILTTEDSQAACFKVLKADGPYAWLLERPQRAKRLRAPKNHPQPSFFWPF
jgi:ASCH domain